VQCAIHHTLDHSSITIGGGSCFYTKLPQICHHVGF